VIVLVVLFSSSKENEIRRFSDPTGQYVVVVSSRVYQSPLNSLPGQSSDKSGFIRIEDNQGHSYGKVKLPMLWMADDLKWDPDGARLVGAGIWNFTIRECTQWD